ncbi:MAG: branched-chain amino acid ABC transporter permease [Candidatus Thorarchaeota archaeon]|nr:branched-chain amino acid ABC transporter permease [Candidatus Thorarchaeota archaeon]
MEAGCMDVATIFHMIFLAFVTGFIYSLLAIGINFVLNVVKIINWAMGEFYLIGGYVQYYLIVLFLGPSLWWVAIIISMGSVALLGALYQKFLLKPMYSESGEKKEEFATIITIITSVLIINLLAWLLGPTYHAPPSYWGVVTFFGMSIDGNKIIALFSTILIIAVFLIATKYTWTGKGLRACAQNRVAAESIGMDLRKYDMIAFAIGVAFAAAAGALLAAVFPLTAQSGKISTMKGFQIIVIGGVGSIMGGLVGGVLLAMIEAIASVLFVSSYRDIYGFIFMILILLVKPTGLFGEEQREA